ncbi:hypothetical protein AC579_10518 [Pseudocercospora musae]|uniref:Uncharacterized protein n=1 Tax=Pseudocercospora musae TaxID=113226 RepID=A0A139I4Y2_9PEZI|nr:hypothetical protein AC579_10518 [Pseudocercospora musae]
MTLGGRQVEVETITTTKTTSKPSRGQPSPHITDSPQKAFLKEQPGLLLPSISMMKQVIM